jgi:hypothetical protein
VALMILRHGSRSSRAALRAGRDHSRHDRAEASSVVRPIGMAERRSKLRRYGCDPSSCTTSSIPWTGQRGRPQPALQLRPPDVAPPRQRAQHRGPDPPIGQPDLLDCEDRPVRFFSLRRTLLPCVSFTCVSFLGCQGDTKGGVCRTGGGCPHDTGGGVGATPGWRLTRCGRLARVGPGGRCWVPGTRQRLESHARRR